MAYPNPPEEIADEASLRELVDALEDALEPRGFHRQRGLGWEVVASPRRPVDLVAGWCRNTDDARSQATMNSVTLFLDGRILLGLDQDVSVVLYARPETLRREGSDLPTTAAGVGGFIDSVDGRLGTVVLPHSGD